MKIEYKDTESTEKSGYYRNEVILADGRKAEITFSFLWDEKSKSFPRITDGELKDSFGLIGRFSKFGNIGDWKIFDKDFKKEVSKILSDSLAVLRITLMSETVSYV